MLAVVLDAGSAAIPTPGPTQAAELLERIALNLDLCPSGQPGTAYSYTSMPPSCRSRFLYWIYDDPSTTYSAPDRLYLYGGVSTSFVKDSGAFASERVPDSVSRHAFQRPGHGIYPHFPLIYM